MPSPIELRANVIKINENKQTEADRVALVKRHIGELQFLCDKLIETLPNRPVTPWQNVLTKLHLKRAPHFYTYYKDLLIFKGEKNLPAIQSYIYTYLSKNKFSFISDEESDDRSLESVIKSLSLEETIAELQSIIRLLKLQISGSPYEVNKP